MTTTTMTQELADAISAAGPEVTASLALILANTTTPGSREHGMRQVLAVLLDRAERAEVGGPDQTLVDFMADWARDEPGQVSAERTGCLIRAGDERRVAGVGPGTRMQALTAAVWAEVDAALLAAYLAGQA